MDISGLLKYTLLIVYIKTPDSSHIKLQISEITLDEEVVNGPDSTFINTRLGSFKLRWAVDSLGNGKFKKDNAEINVKNGLTGSKNNVIFYSLVNGHPYLFLSDKISLNNASEIRVYDIRGRTIVSKHIKSLRPISLSQFSKGIYIASRSSGNKAFNCKFTLSK